MAYRPKDTQERILHRLKIARGHLDKVIQMIKEDCYCIDVLHQMQAVESAIAETEGVVLENHLKTCAVNSIRKGKHEEAIEEIMAVFKNKKQ
ncbi:MAG: metal-sensitive transcriptional regulator [Candidatus Levybacteria bacterium]|nr:metal-sensitive transcriptional regulator [Candidatus Levybacteria bacterium]